MGHIYIHASACFRDQPRLRALFIDAARCWRLSRDAHVPTMPALFGVLAAYRCAVLTPVFDSLLRSYELYLARPVQSGSDGVLSLDEDMLLKLVAHPRAVLPNAFAAHGADAAEILRCALSSTRVMLALTDVP